MTKIRRHVICPRPKKKLQLNTYCPITYYIPNCNDPLSIMELTRCLSVYGGGKGKFNSRRRCCHLAYPKVKYQNRIWWTNSSIMPFMWRFPAVFRDRRISALSTSAQKNLEERLAPSEKQTKGRNILQSQTPPHDISFTISFCC